MFEGEGLQVFDFITYSSVMSTLRPTNFPEISMSCRQPLNVGYTISLELECINCINQISIAGQRCVHRGGVALHQARPMRLQGRAGPSKPRLHDLNAALQILPEPFDRVPLRTVGWQPHENDVLGYGHALGPMRRGLVQPDNVATCPLGLATLVQKEAKALGVQVRQFPPEGFPGGGCDRRIQPVGLLEGLDDLDWLHAGAREAVVEGQM